MGRMKESADLFTYEPPKATAFGGATYAPGFDYDRLKGQLKRVCDLMRDGQWRILPEIARAAGGSEAACSARLRDLRKKKYGSHAVERQRVAGGLWRYRLTPR